MKKFAVIAAAWVAVVSLTGCGDDKEAEKNPDGTEKLEVTVTVERPCVKPGEAQRAVAKTEKKAQIGFLLSYPHGVPDKKKTAGVVDAEGVYVGEWDIPADTPPGESRLQIVGAKGPKTFQAEERFKVAGPDGTCA